MMFAVSLNDCSVSLLDVLTQIRGSAVIILLVPIALAFWHARMSTATSKAVWGLRKVSN